MRFHRLTFRASLFLTVAMIIVALFFDLAKDEIIHNISAYYGAILIFVILVFFLNYIILDQFFSFYGKRQMRQISTILPDEIRDSDSTNLNFKELSERVSEFRQKNATELDAMKDMEIYRKEYLGNVSHELKTPLFSIQGYVETLLDGGVEDLAVRDKYLERIDRSVERLLNIVNDLDMINQYEMGEISLKIENFDLNLLIKEIIDLLDLETQKNNSKVLLQTSATQIFVKADKQRISQVLLNLISNALHYANRDKAQIIIKTQSIGNQILVEVKDNGMGIKPENLPRIFERFYRVETSRNRREGGSGLGLAIVKHILEAHGENISAESVYLEGTKFTFSLQKSD